MKAWLVLRPAIVNDNLMVKVARQLKICNWWDYAWKYYL